MNIKSCVDWQHVCRPIRRQRPLADAAKLCYSKGAGFFSFLSLPPSPRSLCRPSTRPRPSRANPRWRPHYEFCFFDHPTACVQAIFWTDSTCVLRYIANQDKLFQTFVANRPATIQEVSSPSQWRYVNTQSNPADDASRGVSADSLHRWIHGPEFLTQPTDEWPQRPADMITDIPNNDPEVKTETAACLTKTCTRDPVGEIMEKFSSWSRLKKVVAWILRYKTNLHELKNQRPEEPLKIKSARTISPISVTELKNAQAAILKCIQGKSFKQECDQIKHANRQSSASNHKDLRKSSSIYLQAWSSSRSGPSSSWRSPKTSTTQYWHQAPDYSTQRPSHSPAHSPILPPRFWPVWSTTYIVTYPSEVLDNQRKVDSAQSSG